MHNLRRESVQIVTCVDGENEAVHIVQCTMIPPLPEIRTKWHLAFPMDLLPKSASSQISPKVRLPESHHFGILVSRAQLNQGRCLSQILRQYRGFRDRRWMLGSVQRISFTDRFQTSLNIETTHHRNSKDLVDECGFTDASSSANQHSAVFECSPAQGTEIALRDPRIKFLPATLHECCLSEGVESVEEWRDRITNTQAVVQVDDKVDGWMDDYSTRSWTVVSAVTIQNVLTAEYIPSPLYPISLLFLKTARSPDIKVRSAAPGLI